MTLDITQFYQTFFDEADELLAQMEQLLLNLDVGSPDPEDLAAIFRAAHSIKGGAATFGFSALTETTHILESLLDRARNHELTLTKEMVDAFLETKDVLSDQLVDYRASAEPDAAAAAAICAKLERLKAESGAGASGAAPAADFGRALARLFFGDASGEAARCYRELGAIHETGFPMWNGSPLQSWNPSPSASDSAPPSRDHTSRRASPVTTGALCCSARSPIVLYVDARRPKNGTNSPRSPAFWSATNPQLPPEAMIRGSASTAPNLSTSTSPRFSRCPRTHWSIGARSSGRYSPYIGNPSSASAMAISR